MKNTAIAKIRQLLQTAQDYAKDSNIARLDSIDAKQTYKWIMQDMFKCVDEALALLPCETCGGSGRMAKYNQVGDLVVGDPCPDCQPKECICCEEITEENAHLHRNCGK